MRGINVLKPLTGLVSCTFIDYVKHKLPYNIKDVNDNGVIEIDVVSQIELKSAGCFPVLLIVFTIFCQVFKRIVIDIVACTFKYVF
jgi:hypothetical protein